MSASALWIHTPQVSISGQTARLSAQIEFPAQSRAPVELFYETDAQLEPYLRHGLGDAFVTALLPLASARGWDIQSEAPVTPELKCNLNALLLPILGRFSSHYKKISVIAPQPGEISPPSAHQVGTGLSCGVDSLDAVHSSLAGEGAPVSCLTLFNAGSHRSTNGLGGAQSEALFRVRMQNAADCAQAIGLPLLWVNSNLGDLLEQPYKQVHQFCNFSAVMALGGYFSSYHYASGYDLSAFDVSKCDQDTVYIESLLASLLSTRALRFYIVGMEKSRMDKVRGIADWPVAQAHLNVCFKEGQNCGVCEKCRRTQLELYALGKLDQFSAVFDVPAFYQNLQQQISYVYRFQHQPYYREILEQIQANPAISLPPAMIRRAKFARLTSKIHRFKKKLTK